MLVFSTRPEAIKLCPLVIELKKRPVKFSTVVCVTAQHREMLDHGLRVFVTEVILVGPEDKETSSLVRELKLERFVTDTGRLSYKASLSYISLASICVFIEGKMSEGIYFPSKLADYITAKKPILALTPLTEWSLICFHAKG